MTFILRRELVLSKYSLVFSNHADVVHLFAFNEAGITTIRDFNFTQHLTYDDFNVLIVDFYTLQTVNVLNFIYDVVR
ncbi:hypothetical protein D3C78_945440 [compost metagenome]